MKELDSDLSFYIVIPAHNEEETIAKTLNSLVNQRYLPHKILVVDDNSSDQTSAVVTRFCNNYDFIDLLQVDNSGGEHLPGAKVVNAFNKGLRALDNRYDVICKFDADLIFPEDYLETLNWAFRTRLKLGLAGGHCYIEEGEDWVYEGIADKNHVRGPLKAYRKACFEEIGGLEPALGWDTLDELMALYYGWEVTTFEELKVKHLRPTGKAYAKGVDRQKGEVFYRLGYDLPIALAASAKTAWNQKRIQTFGNSFMGYLQARFKKGKPFPTKEQQKWIRKYRWKKMLRKINPKHFLE